MIFALRLVPDDDDDDDMTTEAPDEGNDQLTHCTETKWLLSGNNKWTHWDPNNTLNPV